MNFTITQEWLERQLVAGPEPDGCGHCGAIAGTCAAFPKCPQGASCLCCGRVGTPKVWVIAEPKHYVCETCRAQVENAP